MAKIDLKELDRITRGDMTWQQLARWVEHKIDVLRQQREVENAELRRLDFLLGQISVLRELLTLPDMVHRERTRDPVSDDGFDIPPLQEM